jgi:hypothetical protein
MLTIWALLALCLGLELKSQAQPQTGAPPAAADKSAKPTRGKSISFEDSVVEGMNKNPLDSLEHTIATDKNGRTHLYQKKPHFKVEMRQAARDAGYGP